MPASFECGVARESVSANQTSYLVAESVASDA
jgi:hypothetical protein